MTENNIETKSTNNIYVECKMESTWVVTRCVQLSHWLQHNIGDKSSSSTPDESCLRPPDEHMVQCYGGVFTEIYCSLVTTTLH